MSRAYDEDHARASGAKVRGDKQEGTDTGRRRFQQSLGALLRLVGIIIVTRQFQRLLLNVGREYTAYSTEQYGTVRSIQYQDRTNSMGGRGEELLEHI